MIESLSPLPGELEVYCSLTFTTPVQPPVLHERLPFVVFVEVPTMSTTTAVTIVPAQTGMRCAVGPRAVGLTMCPLISCRMSALTVGL